MQLHFGSKFPAVFVCHFPSYDRRARGKFLDGSIMLCGHVHNAWKHCLDLDHSVLNINVGVDAWSYEVITEDELVKYVMKVIAMPKSKLTKAKLIEGKVTYA